MNCKRLVLGYALINLLSYKGKPIPDIEFVFTNKDFGVPENPDLIYPIERMKK